MVKRRMTKRAKRRKKRKDETQKIVNTAIGAGLGLAALKILTK